MKQHRLTLPLAALALIAAVGCGGGGSSVSGEVLTGGSSRVWRVSLIDGNRDFGGDGDSNTYTACPNSYSRRAGGTAWTCGATDTITFHEDRRVTYSVGATPGAGTWSLRGSTLTIAFDGRTTTDQVEVRNNNRLILRRISRTTGGVSDTTEAGNAYVIVDATGE